MVTKYITRGGRRIEVKTLESSVTHQQRRHPRADLHIGCPLEWVKRVITVVQSKEQLAVAIWLHRRRAVCKRELFDIPNDTLRKELGLSRFVKYSTVQHLEVAGAIAVIRDNKRAIQVKILW